MQEHKHLFGYPTFYEVKALDKYSKLVYNKLVYYISLERNLKMRNHKYENDIMTKERVIKHKIRKFNHTFDKVLHEQLRDTDFFGGEARLLMLLSEQENVSQKELAKKMGTSPASVGVSIKKIEEKGFVLRENDENDSRANKITLTQKGDDGVENLHKIFQALDKATFVNFSEDEMETLEKLMDKLQNNLNRMLEESR